MIEINMWKKKEFTLVALRMEREKEFHVPTTL